MRFVLYLWTVRSTSAVSAVCDVSIMILAGCLTPDIDYGQQGGMRNKSYFSIYERFSTDFYCGWVSFLSLSLVFYILARILLLFTF